MMAADSLDDAIKQAKKVLGDKAVVPSPKIDPEKLDYDLMQQGYSFDKATDNAITELEEMENAVSSYKNGMDQIAAEYEEADFDLNPKSKDDAKKIKGARQIFSNYFAAEQTKADQEMKQLKELGKHLVQLDKYKPLQKCH
jgi:hypothetical protein